MTDGTQQTLADDSAKGRRFVDEVCADFIDAFRAGRSPRLEDYLGRLPEDNRSAALRELLKVEVELRRARCEAVHPEEYLGRFAGMESTVHEACHDGDEVVATLNYNGRSGAATEFHGASTSGSGRLEVCCPTCQARTEVAADTPLTDLTCSSCGSHFSLVDQAQPTRMAPTLTKLGRFDLIERLGVGGFGSVWKARDKELDRTVAVKVPRAHNMTLDEREKFFREARAAAQLRHPNIVSVHEVGRDGDSVYIVSDFIRGVTLGDWLTGQQLTSRETAELCATITDALQHAHEQGVVHRDLKPANIMIDDEGQPHLMDFGLARRETGEISVTADGQILGTPAYMSPEQAQGEAHTADRRSDIYSLGVIMFQLLTGELPFRGNARMLMHQVIHDEPPSPRKLNSNINRDLETITLKCLEKSPPNRYQTAKELAEELRRVLRGEPILARPIGPFGKTVRWARRKPALATLSAVSLIVAVAATTSLSLGYVRESRLRHEANTARAVAEASRIEAEKIAGRNRSQWYAATMNVAAQAWEQGDVRQLLDLLVSQIPESGERDPRGFEWYYWWKKCEPFRTCTIMHAHEAALATYGRSTGHVRCVRYSPDGKQLATGLSSGYIAIWNASDCQMTRTLYTEGSDVQAVEWSSDGSRLVSVSGDGRALIWNMDDEDSPPLVIRHEEGSITQAVISPDRQTICTGGRDGVVRSWDAETGQHKATFTGHNSPVASLAFSPNGEMLAAGTRSDDLVLWRTASQEVLHRLSTGPDHVGSLCFDPSGEKLASSAYQRVYIIDVLSGEKILTHWCHRNELVYSVAWSPDGRVVATGGGDKTVEIWSPTTGDKLATLKGHRNEVYAVHFSPDGSKIASAGADQSIIQWTVPPERFRKQVRFQQDDPVPPLALSPNSSLAATPGPNGQIAVWDYDSAALVRLLKGHSQGVYDLQFFPDGRLVSCGGPGWRLRLWNLEGESYEQVASIQCSKLAVSPGGETLAVADGYATITLLDGKALKKRLVLRGHVGILSSICFSPDGKLLASTAREGSGAGDLFIWNTTDGSVVLHQEYFTTQIHNVQFSPDGKLCAAGIDQGVLLLDLDKAERVATLGSHAAAVIWLAFSPDGKTLASGDAEGKVHCWDTTTYASKGAIGEMRQPVSGLGFSSSGALLAVAHANGPIQLLRAPLSDNESQHLRQSTADEVYPRETWSVDARINRLRSKTRRSSKAVAEAVKLARTLPVNSLLSNQARITLGEWHILDDAPEKALPVLAEAIARGGKGYYYKSYRWALWAAGKKQEAAAAFEKAISTPDLAAANLDDWAAAYFLDRVTETQFLARSAQDPDLKETFAWFYIGQRRESEGAVADAIAAYQNSIDTASRNQLKRGISNWSAYRLHRLKERQSSSIN